MHPLKGEYWASPNRTHQGGFKFEPTPSIDGLRQSLGGFGF